MVTLGFVCFAMGPLGAPVALIRFVMPRTPEQGVGMESGACRPCDVALVAVTSQRAGHSGSRHQAAAVLLPLSDAPCPCWPPFPMRPRPWLRPSGSSRLWWPPCPG